MRRFLEAAGLAADAVVGVEPVRRRRITAEKVAIAAVMAGVPAGVHAGRGRRRQGDVRAGVRAARQHRQHGRQRAVHRRERADPPRARHERDPQRARQRQPRQRHDRPRRCACFIINVLGGIPGQLDRSTLGHPGKFTFCVAEDEEDSPWLPLAAERGVAAGASAVTVLAVESPHQIMNEWTHDPKEIARHLRGRDPRQHAHVLDLGRELRHRGAQAAPADLRGGRVEQARSSRVRPRARRACSAASGATSARRPSPAARTRTRVYTALRSPDDLLVIAAGGPAGRIRRDPAAVVRQEVAGRDESHRVTTVA